jgi:hypothetical protein
LKRLVTAIIVKHDSISYEESTETVEYIQQALKQAAHEATVLISFVKLALITRMSECVLECVWEFAP